MNAAQREDERSVLAYRVTFIPGDGTGPELAEATQRVIGEVGKRLREAH